MRQFDTILVRYGILSEADAQAALGNTDSALPGAGGAQQPAPDPAQGETIDNQQPPAPTTSRLSPESYVTLVKLLKAAFLAEPSEEDAANVSELKFTGANGQETNEINETNADEAFQKLLPIISKYTAKDKTVEGLLKSV